ncbi:hypothetical protein E6C55_10155 [Cohnella fermenti]|uniref:Flippase n=1 Tax=Cohnella fermenti TaxID=2565925 RepID=A0A4S4C006_9BACL|nr:hypothetical protein E6C55_10155 [Cohnella fermenti]
MSRKLVSDSILNIIASSVPILFLQFIVLPIVGRQLGEQDYGLAVTIISLSTLFSLPFGSVLNNIRLLLNDEYQINKSIGDFNILLAASIIINSILMVVGTIYYEEHFSILNIIFVALFSCLNIIREYLIVSFRIIINYKAILINNLILAIGYLVGLVMFIVTGYWQLIFIFGASFSLLYIINKNNLINEKFAMTHLFKGTLYKSIILFFSVFMKTIITYADKLLLFPLIGPAAVSYYYSATIVGKFISMVTTPISGVLLSYLTKMERIRTRDFVAIITITTIVATFGYFIVILISEPILTLLYPKWADRSLELIYITTATALIGVISSIIQPFQLRFNDIKWQFIINLVNVLLYVICTILFYREYGLIGFCWAMLISSIVKLLMMIGLFILDNEKRNRLKLQS